MKPPPRKRVKVDRNLVVLPVSCSSFSKWQQPEKKKLIKALNRLSKANGGNVDIDYSFLKTCIVTRSMSEIQGVVESLKEKVISNAMSELNKWKSEKKLRKPIEFWTEMAFTVTGSHEEHISTAFSQMLMVSSIEPCTLTSCDPPQVHRPPTCNLVERTVPPRPILHMPVQARPVKRKGSPVNQQFSETQSAAYSLAAEKSSDPPSRNTVVTWSASATSVQQSASVQPSSGSPDVTLPPAIGILAVSGVAPSSLSHNVPTAAVHTQLGRTGKYASKNSPRRLGVKCVVDFEKIYRYLSEIHKPNTECNLTPMENAIVLDLLMSLPEELLLLDCNKLHKHLIEVYKCLSSPASSRDANDMLKKLKSAFLGQAEARSSLAENCPIAQQSAAMNADGGQKPQQNESIYQNTHNQPSNTVVTGFNPPPLNPFIIPLEMLMRK